MENDYMTTFGGAVKALGNGKVGGYLVLFGDETSRDLEDDWFDASTDFDIDDGAKSTVYYQHGQDPDLGKRKLGRGTLKVDDTGAWIEAQLQMRDAYERAIYQLAEEGKLGWSSGTAPHLVEREKVGKGWRIKRWPLGLDASLTPTPADPRNMAQPLKSLITADEADQAGATGNPEAEPEARKGGEAATRERLQLQAKAYLYLTEE